MDNREIVVRFPTEIFLFFEPFGLFLGAKPRRARSPERKTKGVQLIPHFLLAPRLRMSGAVQPLSHTLLRRAHGQLYRYLHDREGYQRMLRVHTLLPCSFKLSLYRNSFREVPELARPVITLLDTNNAEPVMETPGTALHIPYIVSFSVLNGTTFSHEQVTGHVTYISNLA